MTVEDVIWSYETLGTLATATPVFGVKSGASRKLASARLRSPSMSKIVKP